jgi:ABC-type phosphate/phosphonate transport system substrate-binding protein
VDVSTWGFGVVRAETMAAPQAVLAEICELASAATGEKWVPQFAETYRELSATLGSGKTGLAWMPPIPAVDLEESGGGFVLVLPARKGQATYHSALIARKGTVKTIEDCKGKSVAWVDHESASGYVIPRIHLASLGIDVASFFSKEIFAKTHMGVVDAVVAARADVGATFCNFTPGSKIVSNAAWTDADGSNPRAVDMLTSTGAIPNDAIVGTSKLPLPLRASVTRFLIELSPRGKQLFEQLLRATEFRVSRPGHFEPLKHMVRMARVRGFTIPPPPK